jgi:hypothetical protein
MDNYLTNISLQPSCTIASLDSDQAMSQASRGIRSLRWSDLCQSVWPHTSPLVMSNRRILALTLAQDAHAVPTHHYIRRYVKKSQPLAYWHHKFVSVLVPYISHFSPWSRRLIII